MDQLSDEHIANAIQTGDSEAFGELITRYETKLKRYGRKFLSTTHEIDDLVQDVFIKAYTNIQSFDTKKSFSPWIYRIAHNTFVNELKRKSRTGLGTFDADVIFSFLPARETADGDTLAADLGEELTTYIEKLPTKYREVTVLHYFESLSYQEISDILQIPVTTVGVRMTRARAKLREYYESNTTHHA